MKTIFLRLLAMVPLISLLSGCRTPSAIHSAPTCLTQATRNNSYSLLYQLLDQQKDVSFLHFIKKEHRDVKDLVKRIATASGTGADMLKEFAREDASLRLDQLGLPPGESAARDAIAATKQKALLGQKGDEFELNLLLTETEALNYAWHLADVAAQNDPQPRRAQALTQLGADMQELYNEVFELVLAKTTTSATP